MKDLFKNYWMVLLVGAFFALTSIYNTFGLSMNVAWNTYIKTVRSLFIIALISMHIKKLPNTSSMIFAFGGIGVMLYLMIFRWMAAYVSSLDYDIYMEVMKSHDYRLLFTIIIFTIFIACNYLNRK